MDYSAGFLLASIWAACFSMLFFGLPGVLSIALLDEAAIAAEKPIYGYTPICTHCRV